MSNKKFIKVDEKFWVNRTIKNIGYGNAGYFIALVSFSKDNRTDGELTRKEFNDICSPRVRETLVKCGLVERKVNELCTKCEQDLHKVCVQCEKQFCNNFDTNTVYKITDFLDWQDSKSTIENRSKANKINGSKGGKVKSKPEGNTVTDGKQKLSESLSNSVSQTQADTDIDIDIKKDTSKEVSKESELSLPAPKTRSARKNKTSFPEDFMITPEMKTWFVQQNFSFDMNLATSKWIDAMKAHGRKYIDWTSAWRNGMHKQQEWSQPKYPVRKTADEKVASGLALAERLQAEADAGQQWSEPLETRGNTLALEVGQPW